MGEEARELPIGWGRRPGHDRTERIPALAAASGLAPEDVVRTLLDAATVHAAGEPFAGDVTILCVRGDETDEA